jgi:hypothetical protein
MADARTLDNSGEHGDPHGDTPKMPGKPKRVQPSRDTDLKGNQA